jgi:hypothetical protein
MVDGLGLLNVTFNLIDFANASGNGSCRGIAASRAPLATMATIATQTRVAK